MASALIAVLAQTAASQTALINREYTIKAAFLYKFSNYVTWPETAFGAESDPFVIGVYGENPFGKTLDTIADAKKVSGRTIVVKKVSSAQEALGCHILFLSRTATQKEIEAVASIASESKSVLIVGESDSFVDLGGDVQFFIENNKVRFTFNERVASGEGLKVSSKLLALARPAPSSQDPTVAY